MKKNDTFQKDGKEINYKHFYEKRHGIVKRCYDGTYKCFKNYGGKGIISEWNNINEFRNDMLDSYIEHIKKYGEKQTTLDRIDNNKNYCKDNCRWATYEEQARNKTTSKYFTYKGITKTIKEFADDFGLSYKRVYYRIHRFGWSIDKSLETPIQEKFISLKNRNV